MTRLHLATLGSLLCLTLLGCSTAERGEPLSNQPADSTATDLVAVEYEPLTEQTFTRAMTQQMFDMGTVHVEMTGGPFELAWDMRFGSDDHVAMSGVMTQAGVTREMIVIDGVIYVSDEGESTYGRFPEDVNRRLIDQMETGSPAAMGQDFERGMDTLEYVGEDPVDGAALHRYRLTMTGEFVAEETGFDLANVPGFHYDVWLDEDALTHRITMNAEGLAGEMDVRMTNWGDPVDIQAPPPSEVEMLEVPTAGSL